MVGGAHVHIAQCALMDGTDGSSNAKNNRFLPLNTLISQSKTNAIAVNASFISASLKVIFKKVEGAAFNIK